MAKKDFKGEENMSNSKSTKNFDKQLRDITVNMDHKQPNFDQYSELVNLFVMMQDIRVKKGNYDGDLDVIIDNLYSKIKSIKDMTNLSEQKFKIVKLNEIMREFLKNKYQIHMI